MNPKSVINTRTKKSIREDAFFIILMQFFSIQSRQVYIGGSMRESVRSEYILHFCEGEMYRLD